MSAPAGTGLEQNYKPVDDTYYLKGDYKGGVMLPPAHKRANANSSGAGFDPHTPVPQNVIEYEDDGITVKSTTVLDPKALAMLSKANESHVTANEPQGPDKTITYKHTMPKKTMSYEEAAEAAKAPPLNEQLEAAATASVAQTAPEMTDIPPPAMPRFRIASEEPPLPEEESSLVKRPTPNTRPVWRQPEPELKRALTQVSIASPMGRCNVKCVDIFAQDMFLVMVQHEDISGVFESVMDPETDLEIAFDGKRHQCRTLCHYKMPDGKTAHSVYLLLGVEG